MRRAILSSVLIIGAALAVVFAGGTFSAFSDDENIGGTVNAAILDFELQIAPSGASTGTDEAANNETLTIDFAQLGALCTPQLGSQPYFAPGDKCIIAINLTRPNEARQLAADLSVSAFTVGGDAGAINAQAGTGSFGEDCDGNATNGANNDGKDWSVSYAFADNAGSALHMPAAGPDAGQQIILTVALDTTAAGGPSGTTCQGSTIGAIAIQIHAAQSADPHSTTD